jgi:hypothetical protein
MKVLRLSYCESIGAPIRTGRAFGSLPLPVAWIKGSRTLSEQSRRITPAGHTGRWERPYFKLPDPSRSWELS